MDELRHAAFHVLPLTDESRKQSYQEQQEHNLSVQNIPPKHSCGASNNANRSHLQNYRNEVVICSKSGLKINVCKLAKCE